jgi:uncharacterized ion transporter superfamily protein YfcC
MRLPHPALLMLAGIAVAAGLTWILPAGEFDRREDPSSRRRVVVAGTYHEVPRTPVGPFQAAVAVPRGFAAAADVVAVVLFVGGAWVVVERMGALAVLTDAIASRFSTGGLMAISMFAVFFGVMGALENMQEEIIPLVPVMLSMGERLGIDPISVVAMSAGAAMIGSAFGPTNPFQAGIALKLAELPPLSAGGLRTAMFVAAMLLWIGTILGHSRGQRADTEPSLWSTDRQPSASSAAASTRVMFAPAVLLLAMAIYVYGALARDWGFDELSGLFLVGGFVAGFTARIGATRTAVLYLEGMQALLPAAVMIGLARAISLVLEDGHVVDGLLLRLEQPLGLLPPAMTAFLLVPFQALVHVVVPSVSGQAVLTMPLVVPLADLLHLSRQVPVLAYQTGAGLMELLTPTNGALMAVLLAAGVSYGRWMRFAALAVVIQLLVGVAGIALMVVAGT